MESVKNQKCNQGFTIVEIILVVIIITILAAMVVPNLAGRSKDARNAACLADIESNLSVAFDLYELDNGRYPTTEQGIQALIIEPTNSPTPTNWNGPYLKKSKKIPKDPWGNEYVYEAPGTHNTDSYDLSCLGDDGIESSDDITNWE